MFWRFKVQDWREHGRKLECERLCVIDTLRGTLANTCGFDLGMPAHEKGPPFQAVLVEEKLTGAHQGIKPRLLVEKLPMFGKTSGMSASARPNQRAIVAAY